MEEFISEVKYFLFNIIGVFILFGSNAIAYFCLRDYISKIALAIPAMIWTLLFVAGWLWLYSKLDDKNWL